MLGQVKEVYSLLLKARGMLSEDEVKKQFKKRFGDNTLNSAVVDTYVADFISGQEALPDPYGIIVRSRKSNHSLATLI